MIENKPKNGICKIHNVRFYNLTPRSINYMAYNRKTCKLAVSRNDASIEIWDMRHAVYMEKSILGSRKASIEALGWINERLFSTGHTGELTEWNLKTLKPKQSVLLTGNAAWCLDVNRSNECIAVGTEEGYVNIFNVTDDDLNYVKIFDKQEGRILCCKYDHSGDILVTGSVDTVRVWDVKTGHAIYRMATGRSENKNETIVWSLAVLKDLTIISGDSRGKITIWDGKMGAQIDSFVALKSDVLAVAVNEAEDRFVCSGIDPILKMFVSTSVKKDNVVKNCWIKFIQRSVHDHDVTALEFTGTKVFSGGIDGYLGISCTSKDKPKMLRYGPFLPQPCASIVESSRLILLKYFNYLEIWRLGTPSESIQLCNDEADSDKFLALEKGIEKLIELRGIDDEPIVSSSISPNGQILIYSTDTSIRVFRLNIEEDAKTPHLTRIKNLPEQLTPSTKTLFSSNSEKLFMARHNGFIDLFNITKDDNIEYHYTIDMSKIIKDTLTHLSISKCGKYLVCVGTCCTIAVWKMSKKKEGYKHYLNLPKYHLAPTAIALHQNSPILVATFPDLKTFEYHLEEMRFTCSTQSPFVPNAKTHAVCNIALDPRNENIVILHNNTFLYVLEKQSSKFTPKAAKTRKSSGDETSSDPELMNFSLKFSKAYEHIVHLSWLSTSEMVAVGVNPVTLIEQLPPCLRQKKFGIS